MSGKGKAAAAAAPAKKGAKAAAPAKGKAAAAAKAARVGSTKRKTRVHYKSHFYRPKTLTLDREPKYKRSLPRQTGAKQDKYRIIRSPLTSER